MVPPKFDVVLVDDAEEVRAVLGRHLRLSGRFEVVGEGSTGADAVRLATELRPTLMVLDASMPGVDGLEALPDVVAVSPKTTVVVFSGFSSPVLERTARSRGATDVIDKGTAIRDLVDRLLSLVGGRAEATDVAGPCVSDAATESAPVNDEEAEAEAVLAEHLERFRTIFDQGAIGMATMTLAGSVVRANPALCRMLERPEEDLVGRSYAELAVEDAEPLRRALHDVARGDRELVAIEHAAPAGRWLRSTIAAVRDRRGRLLYLFTQAENVTDRRRRTEQLRASEERFRLLVEGVRDYAIFMLDQGGHISTWNLGAERMKGYRAEEIIGRHFRVFYEPDAQAIRHPEHELELAVRNGRYEEEGWRVRKDGTRFWANVVITALFDHEHQLAGFAKVTRDVTERRAAAEERDRAAAELQSANSLLRLAAEQSAQFVAVTAHELRSPIAAITGAADLLQDHWEQMTPDDRRESLDSILRGGARIRRLLEDLLLASRLEAGSFEFKLEAFPLVEVLDEARADPGLAGTVETDVPEGLVVWADRTRVVQILSNLLSNATKYGQPPVELRAVRKGPLVEVCVRDGGPGVSEELARHLFEKFVQGPGRTHRGTGLGLFIVRELARGQGGDAWYDGREGSCFYCSLPAADPHSR